MFGHNSAISDFPKTSSADIPQVSLTLARKPALPVLNPSVGIMF